MNFFFGDACFAEMENPGNRRKAVRKVAMSVTLDPALREQLERGAALLSQQRNSSVTLSAFLNELLHKVLPTELERLEKETK